MSVRAGIVVTGTEVLTGRVSDRNGPWLSERLLELGVDPIAITVVGDRPDDILRALRFLAEEGCELVITSGGLGPTADDLTAEVVGRLQGREMVLDEPLEARIGEILRPLMARWPHLDPEAMLVSNRKQAVIPAGAEILEPVGTAPGLVVTPAAGEGPTVVVLPGPPRELQPMWRAALQTSPALRGALAGAVEYRRGTLRLYGIPESEIAATLRAATAAGIDLDRLEVTTCLRRGEVEVVTRYEPAEAPVYEAFAALVRARHERELFSEDGSTLDDQVFAALRGDGSAAAQTIAVAESCTGGLLTARLTDRPGASDVVRGGLVVYSDEAKVALAGVPAQLIERHGAVSEQVAGALADGARAALGADVGVGVTGIAGPGGGSEEKPVGLVWLAVSHADGRRLARSATLPGGRADVRDRSTTVALHLVRRLLLRGLMRLFVALDLPAGTRAALAAWAEAAAPAGLRRVAPENLHLTLAFLGSRSEDDAATAGALLAGLEGGAPGELRTAGALWLPGRRPGVLTVALAAGDGLGALREDLLYGLRAVIGFEAERRPFRPHVTVARVPRGARVDARAALTPPAPELSFRAPALTLYRSHTGAGGARYEALARVAAG